MRFDNLDVIVPTYNRAKYLRIALQAILSSTADWRKTIVLNNASTDSTLEVVEEIQKEFPDRVVEVVTNPVNVGNAGNFKRTQEIAENEYTVVFHDDDVIHPEYIERAMDVLTKNPNIVYAGGVLRRSIIAAMKIGLLCLGTMFYTRDRTTPTFSC